MGEVQKREILVVDDDGLVRSLVRRILEHVGYVVLEAADGTEAIRFVKTRGASISVVVLDMTIPGMDTEQLFAALHKLQPDLPYILYTGGNANAAVQRLLQTGLCQLVFKTASMVPLVKAIELLLAEPPRQQLTSRQNPEKRV